MPIPKSILERIETFHRNLDSYLNSDYKEAQVRQEFIDPLFAALGWDVRNEQGYAEAYKEVVSEDSLRISGAGTKAPDYSFRVGGTRKFFVEAKKPAVYLKDNPEPALQLRRYSWSAKLALGIVTDFQEFAIYDTRIKPKEGDKASVARIFYCTFEQYPEKWDEIADIFAKASVLKGSFDRHATSAKGKRGTTEFDDAFLADMEHWRDVLARNLALRNAKLSQRDLNFAVQRILDRIIFLRIAEDRGIEPYGQLQALTAGPKIYPRLGEIFERADFRYNSGLFHFATEKGRDESPDKLTLHLALDDAALKEIIGALYYPKSPYAFSVIPADILGHVYEQFLGKVITLTAGHHAKVEEKPEVRKAGGVYYTPTYIVDYIVRQTVGALVEGKSPQQVAKLKVLDPACGSGSFLLGAYEFLLDWHLKYYLAHDPAGWAKKKTPPIYETAPNAKGLGHGSGNWQLTTAERKRILVNNLHGVDIDAQAVEVTKLSLLLKVLEGEARELQGKQLDFHRVLPDLGNNIKCGNSLIGSDFYSQPDLPALDDEARLKINAFDWTHEFKPIMEAGGFDAVIGNPPWGAEFSDDDLAYLRIHYSRVIARMIDSYIYFIDKATALAREKHPIGYVIPSTILNQVDTKPARDVLISRGMSHLISLGQGVFGTKVLNTSTIVVSAANPNETISIADLSCLKTNAEKEAAISNTTSCRLKTWIDLVRIDPQHTFFTGNVQKTGLYTRLLNRCDRLESLLKTGIQRGVSPDVAEAHVISLRQAKDIKIESELLKKSISGPSIKRYRPCKSDQWIIYTERNTPIENYPHALRHLQSFKHRNSCREVEDGKHPYWALHRPRDAAIFESPKLIGLTTTKTIELVIDRSEGLFVTDAMYVFSPVADLSPLALAGLMQSRLFLFLYRTSNEGESRVIPQIKAAKLMPLPVPKDFVVRKEVLSLVTHVERMLKLYEELASARSPNDQTHLQRDIAATDRVIDALVYQLYGLTDDEIKLVEAATAPAAAKSDDEDPVESVAPKPAKYNPQAEADAAHHYLAKEDPPAPAG